MGRNYGIEKIHTSDGTEVLSLWNNEMAKTMHVVAMRTDKDSSQFKSMSSDERIFDVQSFEVSNTMQEKTHEQKMLEELFRASISLNPEVFGNALDINLKQYNDSMNAHKGTKIKIPTGLTLGFQEKPATRAKDGTETKTEKPKEKKEEKPQNSAEQKDPESNEKTNKPKADEKSDEQNSDKNKGEKKTAPKIEEAKKDKDKSVKEKIQDKYGKGGKIPKEDLKTVNVESSGYGKMENQARMAARLSAGKAAIDKGLLVSYDQTKIKEVGKGVYDSKTGKYTGTFSVVGLEKV